MYPSEPLKKNTGRIEVICGCMFSGKTEALIKRLTGAIQYGLTVKVFTPRIDTRFSANELVSHSSKSIPATAIDNAAELYDAARHADVIGIDEAQFFDLDSPAICNKLADEGVRVIVSGLDMDYLGHPFGPMPALMAIAGDVTKLHAACAKCGQPAMYSCRLSGISGQILLGGAGSYEPRCRICYLSTDSAM